MPAQQSQIFGKDSVGRNQPVGISDAVAATQALTLSGNAVAGETFTVGYQTYTWVTTLTLGTINQVKVGVDAATSIVNATAAINGGGGGDTLFTAATPVNKFVTAVATSSTVLTVTAKETGAGPNAIPTTETMSNASWGAVTLTGGTYGALEVTAPASGIPITPPTVNGVKVVGIQEVDSSDAFTSPTGHTIAAGGLSWLFFPSSDFVGTLKFGTSSALTWPGSNGPAGRDAEANNTLPGATITCSAGSYMVVEARPS